MGPATAPRNPAGSGRTVCASCLCQLSPEVCPFRRGHFHPSGGTFLTHVCSRAVASLPESPEFPFSLCQQLSASPFVGSVCASQALVSGRGTVLRHFGGTGKGCGLSRCSWMPSVLEGSAWQLLSSPRQVLSPRMPHESPGNPSRSLPACCFAEKASETQLPGSVRPAGKIPGDTPWSSSVGSTFSVLLIAFDIRGRASSLPCPSPALPTLCPGSDIPACDACHPPP